MSRSHADDSSLGIVIDKNLVILILLSILIMDPIPY